jgi:hypothetical protein
MNQEMESSIIHQNPIRKKNIHTHISKTQIGKKKLKATQKIEKRKWRKFKIK